MSKISEIKSKVVDVVESQRDQLIDLSHKIHDNPELAYNEVKAAGWLSEFLEGYGFLVETGIAGLKTAFKAVYGKGSPVLAFLAEYDALPELGHACGHNIIALAATGAGIASRCAVDLLGGTIIVLGTPAEEVSGGKIDMVAKDVFGDIDAALMIHPGSRDIATIQALACISLDIEFLGKPAHAAAHPEEGINALDAMIMSFTAIGALRQQTMDKSRIHGIITNGGEVANVIPDYTSAKFLVRADDNYYLNELKDKVLDCFKGAARATGCKLKHKWGNRVYNTMNSNFYLADLFTENMRSLGREMQPFDPIYGFGSTDMGNVSHVVPAIHPSISITDTILVHTHTMEFARAAVSGVGDKAVLDGAKALAMTIVDLLGSKKNIESMNQEFFNSRQIDL
jgi:amidohydrolase